MAEQFVIKNISPSGITIEDFAQTISPSGWTLASSGQTDIGDYGLAASSTYLYSLIANNQFVRVISGVTTTGHTYDITSGNHIVPNNFYTNNIIGIPMMVGSGLDIYGGTQTGSTLVLSSTTAVTKNKIWFGNLTVYDEANNRLGLDVLVPTSTLHLGSGSTVAGSSPLKFNQGTNMTTPESGAIEYDGTHIFYTDSGLTRQTFLPGAYGEMYEVNTAGTTITSTPTGGYVGWTTPATGPTRLVTFTGNATADRLTILTGGDGDYSVRFTGSISCSTTRAYTIAIYKNGTIVTDSRTQIRSSSTAIYFSVTTEVIIQNMVVNDYVDVRIAGTNNNDAVVLFSGRLVMNRINR